MAGHCGSGPYCVLDWLWVAVLQWFQSGLSHCVYLLLLLFLLSTWQACAPSGPMPVPLSGPLLPRFVQDPFLCTFMCCPMPLFPCSPSPPLLTASKPCPLPSVPLLSHCRTQCICPQCFSFQFSSQSWAISPQLCPLGLWQWAADSRCSVCTVGGCAVSAVGCLTGCAHLVMATVLICR